ncbi:MAG: hypothetical protein C5B52_15450 [Bacteroidetes bacterium]|nr:MAG: hypothetical protein C5B52_15450 [Bacteroidota bacterium]
MPEHVFFCVLAGLATWRVTHLLAKEDGPFEIIFWFRKKAGNGFFGSLMDCFYCLSIWIAIPFAIWIGFSWKERILLWLALSGFACLMESFTSKPQDPGKPDYTED